jgi:hypothetical protein
VPSLASMTSSLPNFYDPIMVSSLDNDSEDENPPLHAQLPPIRPIEHERITTPHLPRWVRATREVASDPTNQRHHIVLHIRMMHPRS